MLGQLQSEASCGLGGSAFSRCHGARRMSKRRDGAASNRRAASVSLAQTVENRSEALGDTDRGLGTSGGVDIAVHLTQTRCVCLCLKCVSVCVLFELSD